MMLSWLWVRFCANLTKVARVGGDVGILKGVANLFLHPLQSHAFRNEDGVTCTSMALVVASMCSSSLLV